MRVEELVAARALERASADDARRGERLLQQACAVLDQLPAVGVTLAALAEQAQRKRPSGGRSSASAAARTSRP